VAARIVLAAYAVRQHHAAADLARTLYIYKYVLFAMSNIEATFWPAWCRAQQLRAEIWTGNKHRASRQGIPKEKGLQSLLYD